MLRTRHTQAVRHLTHKAPSTADIGFASRLVRVNRPLSTTVAREMARPLPRDPLVWIDCEMTGLELSKDRLLEIAVRSRRSIFEDPG